MDKYSLLHQILAGVADSITADADAWKQFLSTAFRLYKYKFEEQLAIYGQKPDAIAVADMDTWNKRIGRMVKRGSSAILIPDVTQSSGVRYVFDYSDTEPYRRKSNLPGRIELWRVRGHEEAVVKSLKKQYGEAVSLEDQLFRAALTEAGRFIEANHTRITETLSQCRMSEYPDGNQREVAFLRLAALSATFLVAMRCDRILKIDAEELQDIRLFDQISAVVALGNTVGYASSTVLRQIERVVKAEERQNTIEMEENQDEKSDEHHLHAEGNVSVPRHLAQRGRRGEVPGQIRLDALPVPEGAAAAAVGRAADEGDADGASASGRGRGHRESEPDGGADGREGSSSRPEDTADGLGAAHGDVEGAGRGSGREGADLRRLTEFELQVEIDAELRKGSGYVGGKQRIFAFFQKDPSLKDAVAFLKKEYNYYGHSHTFTDGTDGFVDYSPKGMRLRDDSRTFDETVKWRAVEKRIRALIQEGSYLSAEEREQFESKQQDEHIMEPPFSAEDITREGDTLTVGKGEPAHEVDITVSDETWEQIRQAVPDSADSSVRESHEENELASEPETSQAEDTDQTGDQEPENKAWLLEEALVGENGLLELKDIDVLSRRFAAGETLEQVSDRLAVTYEGQRRIVGAYDTVQMGYTATNDRFTCYTPAGDSISVSWLEAAAVLRGMYDRELHGFLKNPGAPELERAEDVPEYVSANFRITDDRLGAGTPSQKYKGNMAAIRTLKKIESEHRVATAEEQNVLSRYVGWGGLADCFDERHTGYQQLKALLTDREYAAARASTLNAHYTSPTVIKGIYEAVGGMGFASGAILEPSCGVGNFFGLLPDSMAASKLYGVELDSISGRITKQLYPDADITVAGFETTSRKDFFDLAVGNVPFGNYQVNDPAYNRLGFSIHNYFFAKALDQVRPGGIVAFVTSRYTMDQKNPDVRRYLAQRAELLGAIRLPNNAFKENAGTKVVSDILFLQKRKRPVEIEPDWIFLGQTEDGFAINRYFIEHPEMVLGQPTEESTQYGKQDYTVVPIEGADLARQLREAAARLPKEIYYARGKQPVAETELSDADEGILPDPDVPNNSFTVVDDTLYFKSAPGERMKPYQCSDNDHQRILGMIQIRDCVRDLIQCQIDGGSDGQVEALQTELNRRYDGFVRKWGYLSGRTNRRLFQDDTSVYLLCSLEDQDGSGNVVGKTDFFTKRTIRHIEPVTQCDTPQEALAVTLNECGRVDVARIAALTGLGRDEAIRALDGKIYRVPGQEHHVTADEYLSGNVRKKLEEAREAAKRDRTFEKNVQALEQVQPEDLTADEIDVRLGATWIHPSYVKEYICQLLRVGNWDSTYIKVLYVPESGEWHVEGKSRINSLITSRETYGTPRMSAPEIIERTLNLRDVRVYDKIIVDGQERRVLNADETVAARAKQELIRNEFRDWIFDDPNRRAKLVSEYNRRFNSYRNRSFDGSYLTFPGMSPEIKLRQHQVNAVARGLYGGNTLLAHVVGAGKTYEIAAIAMESKRIGMAHKSLIVVPNHLTEQWGIEFLRLYPAANVLVATERDFSTDRRKQFCTRIATGDWDAVVIGHSQFERIPLSQERQEAFLREQIDSITDGIQELKYRTGEQWTIKAMERFKKGLESRLQKLQDSAKDENVISFESLGIDRIFVDEAQAHKNLFLYTKMQNVAGISQSESQRAFDLYQKCRYLDAETGGRGVIFATGTPVSNSITEMYTMQRYLQFGRLEEMGLSHFDAWASTFGETTTSMELAPEGSGYRSRTRFAKFHNLPELMNMFQEVADIKTADDLKLDVPNAHYETIVAKRSAIQAEMVKELSERATAVHNHTVSPEEDNMLRITTDGRKIGLDQRLIDPRLPDEPGSKVNLAVQNVLRIWNEYADIQGTQLVFCDFSTPTDPKRFNVYSDMKLKLIAAGVPEAQIAFIHDAKTKAAKKTLFQKVREGKVRILFGSTEKMGAGTNVQDRLVAIHDVDCPWRPGDLEQRAGRVVRQGNCNKDVYIYRYVTDATFDAYLYQTVENKQKFISQIMTSKTSVRSCEDVDESVLSYAEIKALCAGDPLIKEKMELDTELTRLKVLRASYKKQHYRLEDMLRIRLPNEIGETKGRIERLKQDAMHLEQMMANLPEDGFTPVTFDGVTYTTRDDAGKALKQLMDGIQNTDPVLVGTWYGFHIQISRNSLFVTAAYQATIRGACSYTVELGDIPVGNITRIENGIRKIPVALQQAQNDLTSLENQMREAEAELQKPWPHEEEFRAKTARLAELEARLTLEDGPTAAAEEDRDEVPTSPSFAERLARAAQAADTVNACRQNKRTLQQAEVRGYRSQQ